MLATRQSVCALCTPTSAHQPEAAKAVKVAFRLSPSSSQTSSSSSSSSLLLHPATLEDVTSILSTDLPGGISLHLASAALLSTSPSPRWRATRCRKAQHDARLCESPCCCGDCVLLIQPRLLLTLQFRSLLSCSPAFCNVLPSSCFSFSARIPDLHVSSHRKRADFDSGSYELLLQSLQESWTLPLTRDRSGI